MDLTYLVQALQAAEKESAASNPYAPLQNVTEQINWNPYQFSNTENVVGGGIKGLLSGLFGGLGDNYQAEQSKQIYGALPGILEGNTTKPDDMDLSVFAPLERAKTIFGMGNDYEEKQAKKKEQSDFANLINKTKLEKDGIIFDPTTREPVRVFDPEKESKAKSKDGILGILGKAIADNPKRAGQAIQAFKDAGLVDDDDVTSIAVPKLGFDEPVVEAAPSVFGLPGKTASQKFREEYQTLMDDNVPGGAAVDAAKALTSVDRLGAKSAQERIEEIRTNARNMAQLADVQESAVQDAGSTGGLLGAPRDLASSIYSLVSPTERAQRSAEKLLDSTQPDIIKASRAAGSGATSDVEFKSYLGAGANSGNTPEANKTLIEKTRNLAKIQGDYADFLDTYMTERGDLTGGDGAPSAEQLWDTYKKSNPLFVKNKAGELEYNSARKDWREFDFASAVQGKQPAGKKTTQQASSGYEIRTARNGQRYKVKLGQ